MPCCWQASKQLASPEIQAARMGVAPGLRASLTHEKPIPRSGPGIPYGHAGLGRRCFVR